MTRTIELTTMPTYEYQCSKGHDFEKLQRMSDAPVMECPVCGAVAERKLSGGAGLIFKGSGFYITDYRSEGYKKAAEADRGGSAPKTEGKPEGAPAAKPETKPAAGGGSASSTSGGATGAGS